MPTFPPSSSPVHSAVRAAASRRPTPAGRPVGATLLNLVDRSLRPFFLDYDRFFTRYWRSRLGAEIEVVQWEGDGEGPAPTVAGGLDADVVSLVREEDVDAIRAGRGALAEDWRRRLPRESVPFRSRLVFLVRPGNPKGIRDWSDLLRTDIRVVESPGLVSLRAAREEGGDPQALAEALVRIAPSLPHAVGAPPDGVDVAIGLEGAAVADGVEPVVPPQEVWGAPRVAVLDAVVDAYGTRTLAEAYAAYLYSPVGQRIAARHGFTPWVL